MQSTPMRTILAYGSNLVALFLLWRVVNSYYIDLTSCFTSSKSQSSRAVVTAAANTTLGFQKIFIIDSSSDPELRDIISLAAALTTEGGFDVEYIDHNTASSECSGPGEGDILRGHMDVLRTIVEKDIESALILEATMDWNRDLKARMRELASATRYLVQPDLESDEQQRMSSPYGKTDLWDVIFLSHYGFDNVELSTSKGAGKIIVPARTSAEPEVPLDQHRDLRKQKRATTPCPLAYGVTQRGARRFLLALMERATGYSMSSLIRDVCDGYRDGPKHNCLASEHQVFHTRHSKGDGGDEWSMISLAIERSM